VVYGDECVHNYLSTESLWIGENNHSGGGNFLFADEHVEWLEVVWTGVPWGEGTSLPSVPNHGVTGGSARGSAAGQPSTDANVFWDDQDLGPEYDADLAGMMWLGDRWAEF
jgi:prepilin-type processing-associated H-X9-DG protein